MKTIHQPSGEFAYRLEKNFTRLQEREYTPDEVFQRTDNGYSWPGDWEGRLILALALHKKMTGKEPRYLRQLLSGVSARTLEHGFMGRDSLQQGLVDEQQLAGHSWLLRGLMTCMDILQDDALQATISRIIESLYLPVLHAFERYPLGDCRAQSGKASGSLQEKPVNGWILSTDIGCCYIALDALSEYFLRFRDDRIRPLLEEMAQTFMRLDVVASSMQTHASLSAVRGIVRLYQATGQTPYLEFARKFLRLYLQSGMTENYANFNWFQRPTWTEPCAVVDSYLLSMELFQLTNEPGYVELANRIFYNALECAQRSNGGFGCDSCVKPGGEQELLRTWEDSYEAYWCCTMRGAEGLNYALRNAFLCQRASATFLNYIPGQYACDGFIFRLETNFPYDGEVRILFDQCPGEGTVLNFWLPQHVARENLVVTFDGKPIPFCLTELGLSLNLDVAGELVLKIPLLRVTELTLHPTERQEKICWYGILQLGCDTEEEFPVDTFESWQADGNGCFSCGGHQLYPLTQGIFLPKERILQRSTRILF